MCLNGRPTTFVATLFNKFKAKRSAAAKSEFVCCQLFNSKDFQNMSLNRNQEETLPQPPTTLFTFNPYNQLAW